MISFIRNLNAYLFDMNLQKNSEPFKEIRCVIIGNLKRYLKMAHIFFIVANSLKPIYVSTVPITMIFF